MSTTNDSLSALSRADLESLVRSLDNQREEAIRALAAERAESAHILGLLKAFSRSDFNGGLEDTKKAIIADTLTRMNLHHEWNLSAYFEYLPAEHCFVGKYMLGSRTGDELTKALSAVALIGEHQLREQSVKDLMPFELKIPLDHDSIFRRRIYLERRSYLGESVDYTDVDKTVIGKLGEPFVTVTLKGAEGNVIGFVYGCNPVTKRPVQMTDAQLHECNKIRYPAATLLQLTSALHQIRDSLGIYNLGLGAAELSHEVRGPATCLTAFAAGLLRNIPPEILNQYGLRGKLEIIQQEGQTIERLLNQVRDYSQVPVTSPEPFDIVAETRTKIALASGGLPYGINYDGPLLIVKVDKEQIREQVLGNILRNAFEAMKYEDKCQGVVERLPNKLTVNIQQEPGIVDLSIHNRQYMEQRILERLSKATLFTRSKKEGSTGLGYATAVRYATANGCSLSIQSSPEIGTVQRLRIPLCRQ